MNKSGITYLLLTAATSAIVSLGIWMHSNHVWVTVQTQDQRTIAAQLARAGNDLAEQYQTVVKF